MKRSRILTALGVLVVVAAAVAHIVYWYQPRPRTGAPPPGSMVDRLWGSGEFAVALWMPFPHQNLGFLRQAAVAENESLRAVANLAGLPVPDLPPFGPMVVPPSTQMVIAADESGERYVVYAEVFPAFAAFAKLAGRLAGNPWLEGGEIYVEGRRAEVRWQGNLWAVASPEFPQLQDAGSELPPAVDPALAVIQLRQPVHPLPSGRYRLIATDGGVELLSSQVAADPDFGVFGFAGRGVFLFTYTGRNPALGEPAESLLGLSGDPDEVIELPRVATIWEPAGERRELPGESLLDLVGRDPHESTSAGWAVAALDGDSLEQASLLAPRMQNFIDSADADLAWAVWLDFEGGVVELGRMVERLAEVPIVARGRIERWRDVHTALAPLARRHSQLTVVVSENPRAFRLRLEPGAGAGS